MKNRQASASGKSKKSVFFPVLSGFIMAMVVIVFGLILTGILVSKADVPFYAIWMITVALAAFSSFVFGFHTAKKLRKKGLFVGFGCGLIICFIIMLSGLIVFSDTFSAQTMMKFVLILTASTLGGFMGVNSKEKRRRR